MKKLLYLLFISSFIFSYSCSKNEDIDLKESAVKLYSGDKYTIKVNSDTKVIYQSKNEYVATVSDKGIVTAEKIGETAILLDNGNDKKTFTVKVMPKYDLYSVPELSFGMSKNILISKYGTPDETDDNTISYKDYSTAAPLIIYKFDNTDLLVSSSVMVSTSYSKDIVPFLYERYKFIEDEDDSFIFIDASTEETAQINVVAKIVDSDYWMIEYMPIILVNTDSDTSNN